MAANQALLPVSTANPDLTKRQLTCLRFLRSYSDTNGRNPKLQEVAEACAMGTAQAAASMLDLLVRKRYVSRVNHGHRKYAITDRAREALDDIDQDKNQLSLLEPMQERHNTT